MLAVFENIICCGMELTGCTRKKSSLVNLFLIILLSMPCVLGYNLWAWDGFAVFGGAVLDFEDFLVSNLFLPLGSLVYLLFCVSRYGWGWDNYKKEVNTGEGLKSPGLECAAICLRSARDLLFDLALASTYSLA